jgi:hypothetical protein
MGKLIHNVALLAMLVALAAGLWQDWGIWLTVKRMLVSYLAFYFFGSFLYLGVRALARLGGDQENPEARRAQNRRSGP